MTGRNDPCPCGSGKKYKHCCLLKEMQQTADRRQEAPAADEVSAAAERDPLIERMNAWWEAFRKAGYEEKWELVDAALRDEPELMDREMVFETGNTLYDEAMERGEHERFERLLESFRERAPEAYERELTFVLEWRFMSALARKAWPAVEDAFLAFSQIAGRDLDLYYCLIGVLAYYGRLAILLEGMREALPSVKVSKSLVPGAASAFAENVATYEIVSRLQEDAELRADDEELQRRLAQYEFSIDLEELDRLLAYRSGRAQPTWAAEELMLSPGDDYEEDPAKQKLNLLLMAWIHDAATEGGVPATKAEMARDHLYRYFVQRSEGELSKYGGRRGREERALVPERGTLNRYMEDMLGFMSYQRYERSALLEVLPLWLRYLRQLELIGEAEASEALRDLGELSRRAAGQAARALRDPQVAENLRAWPDEL